MSKRKGMISISRHLVTLTVINSCRVICTLFVAKNDYMLYVMLATCQPKTVPHHVIAECTEANLLYVKL